MNAFNNHTNVPTASPSAAQVINTLVSELVASDDIMRTLHRFMPAHQLIHAKLDLQARGIVDQTLLRLQERAAVIAMAKSHLAATPTISPAGQDLVRRLRTVAGQTVVQPPALDIEAAAYIERLEAKLAIYTAPQLAPKSRAEVDVLAERERQVAVEGWTPERDDSYSPGRLAAAGSCYAMFGRAWPNQGKAPTAWPFADAWWKPRDDRSNLVRAAALILAEIERLDRAAGRANAPNIHYAFLASPVDALSPDLGDRRFMVIDAPAPRNKRKRATQKHPQHTKTAIGKRN